MHPETLLPALLTAADLLPWHAPPTLPPTTTPAQAQAALESWHVQAVQVRNLNKDLVAESHVWALTPQGVALQSCPVRSLALALAQPLLSQPLLSQLLGQTLTTLPVQAAPETLVIAQEEKVLGLLTKQDVEGDRALGAALWPLLSAAHQQLLETLLSLQREQGRGNVALVGGAVRDLLLGKAAIQDLDCVVVGQDATRLAKALHQRCGGKLSLHKQYGNATISLPDGTSLDLIAARMERYPQPGLAPEVWAGTLLQDLMRRDFGINALALRLNDLALCAPAGALQDVYAATLRPLHARSLHEDPSRLLRAARLAARLNLSAHPDLLAQVPDAVALAQQTPRLWAEMRLLLGEERPTQALKCLQEWDAALLPEMTRTIGAWQRLETVLDDAKSIGPALKTDLYAAALLGVCQPDTRKPLAQRLSLSKRAQQLLERVSNTNPERHTEAERLLTSALFPAPIPTATLPYTPLTSHDLLSLGYSAGPKLGKMLRELQCGRHAGRYHSRGDELSAALEGLQQLP